MSFKSNICQWVSKIYLTWNDNGLFQKKKQSGGWGHNFGKKTWNFYICHFTLGNFGEHKASSLNILQNCVAPLGYSKTKNQNPWKFPILSWSLLKRGINPLSKTPPPLSCQPPLSQQTLQASPFRCPLWIPLEIPCYVLNPPSPWVSSGITTFTSSSHNTLNSTPNKLLSYIQYSRKIFSFR